jgi:hypothetical protein
MVLLIGFIVLIILISQVSISKADSLGQIPTVAVPTVTGTPSGAVATVTMEQDQINVRGGPSTEYPVVGVLIAGQQVPALGRSVGGDWVQIAYPGVAGGIAWVYSPLVIVSGSLPIVEPPPTPTPRTTPTVDPTLAAQFIVEIPPTRLPTFTAPPPLILPTFVPEQAVTPAERVPMGLLIVGMGIIGIFGVMISLLRGR